MSSKITHIIFDVDGTLVEEAARLDDQTNSVAKWFGDTVEDKQKVIDAFFAANDKAQALKDEGQPQFKNNIPWYMQEMAKELGFSVSEEDAKIMAEKWSSAYTDSHVQPQLFPDVIEVLDKLKEKSLKLIVASGNTVETRKQILDRTGISKYFDTIYAATDVGFQKQDIRFWETILKQIDCSPENIVVVGNQINDDIMHPQALGIKTIFVDRPGVLRKKLGPKEVVPDYKINNLQKLLEIV